MIIVMLMCSLITLGITIFLILENKVLVSVIEFYFDSSYKIILQLNSSFSLCVCSYRSEESKSGDDQPKCFHQIPGSSITGTHLKQTDQITPAMIC